MKTLADNSCQSFRYSWYILNGSASDYSISLKFGSEFDHVTADTLQTFKVKGSKIKVRE